jgi:hypothetical protein
MKKSIVFTFLFIIGTSTLSFGQQEGNEYKEPPRKENTYYFNVLNYERQPPLPTFMETRIQQIMQNSKSTWTAKDSLYFAYENVYLEKFELALSLFSKLNTVPAGRQADTITSPFAQQLYRTTLIQTKRYGLLKEYNENIFQHSTTFNYDILTALNDLTAALKNVDSKQLSKDSITIFPILFDTLLNSYDQTLPPHKNKFVRIAFSIDSSLRSFSFLNDQKSEILSKAFEEMGDYQKEYFYISNAYFYYAAARYYDRRNKSASRKYNNAIDEISKQNFLLPSFKNTFSRVIKNRYQLEGEVHEDAEEIDQRPARERFNPPPKKEKKKDYIPWLKDDFLFIGAILIVLFVVMLFIRTSKKRKK